MKAEDLRFDELFSVADGVLSFRGRRVVIHDMHAMGQFRRDLIAMVGEDQARRILTRFGYYWGQTDAAAMKRVFQWESLEDLLRAGPRLHTIQGVTRASVKKLVIGDGGRFHMQVRWERSGEAEEHLEELGRSDHPICWMLTGYASGYASYCLGSKVFFIEESCRGAGGRDCTATGKDEASWGDAIAPHLPFFEADDIRGKIERLTAELAEKDRELSRHRSRLDDLEAKLHPDLAEVRSKSFQETLDVAIRVARFDTSVLITGESGVGKEVVARYIHDRSHRWEGPFVAINCSALPETLLESELFGHKAGSFTGAIRDRAGLLEQAEGGTILLDEIGDLPPALQVKLLRVIQEREIRRIGENRTRPIDVRILAATNRDLEAGMRDGSFRDDLLYRLRVVELRIPPLRERPEDILPLARFFVRRLTDKLGLPELHLDASCLEPLQRYAWPGNVRELENALERAAVLSEGGRIDAANLPGAVRGEAGGVPSGIGAILRPLAEVEDEHIRAVLRSTGGNRARTAEILGISVTTLWRRLQRSSKSEPPPAP